MYEKDVPDMQCKQTKLINIKKFLKNFAKVLKRIIRGNMSSQRSSNTEYNNDEKDIHNIGIIESNLNFVDYCHLLRNLGFIKHDVETLQAYLENDLREDSIHNLADKKQDLKALNGKLFNVNKKSKLVKLNEKNQINALKYLIS